MYMSLCTWFLWCSCMIQSEDELTGTCRWASEQEKFLASEKISLVLTYSNNKFECSSDQLPFSFTVPVLDRILQPSTSVILGPVWVTRGAERFSPKGAYHFITTLLFSTKDRLKQSKAYKQQVWKLMFLKKKGGKKNKLTTNGFNLRQNR